MDKTTITINLSPKLQNFLRFYYKWSKPFFEFPEYDIINGWLSDNMQELPDNVQINFGTNTFKIEVYLLYGQDNTKRYYLNKTFMAMLEHRISNRLKNYYHQKFEESIAEKFGVDFTVINIMNELNIINIKAITEIQGIDLYNNDSFLLIKDAILKNNKTEFERISKKFSRWKGKEYVRKFRAKENVRRKNREYAKQYRERKNLEKNKKIKSDKCLA